MQLFPTILPCSTALSPLLAQTGVIDMFCGIGGLSNGFAQESFRLLAGYDIDPTCQYAYEHNNRAPFICKDIQTVTATEIETLFAATKIKILVGCAPCQPFSSYNFKNDDTKKWFLLKEFAQLVQTVQPDIVSIENVPQLINFKKADVFNDFIRQLIENGYEVSHEIVDCVKYGIPQRRKRLIPPTHDKTTAATVRQVIGHLEPIEHGQQSTSDPLHKAAKLIAINLKRIQQSKQGGTWRDWDKDLILDCHQKPSGKSYMSVYGRMSWHEPSPTITTQFNGIGNGRFGHPDQDRALSLREGALLQTFSQDYVFFHPDKPLNTRTLSTHIGNAVPPDLGRVIAKSILLHLQNHWNHGEEI
jgi:DNA (cytosine-5)-methyltransferase 1